MSSIYRFDVKNQESAVQSPLSAALSGGDGFQRIEKFKSNRYKKSGMAKEKRGGASALNLQKALALVESQAAARPTPPGPGPGPGAGVLGGGARLSLGRNKPSGGAAAGGKATGGKALSPVAAVFDLDSTLFCMKYRTEAILRGFIAERAPESARKKLTDLKVTERDWSVEEILFRYGFPPEDPVTKAAISYWKKRFFTNEFLLKWDRPYPGAVEYVKRMESAGAAVFYLTGRNRGAMGEGSLLSLKQWGFPAASRLILKENADDDDALYKAGELAKIRRQYKFIVFFENEPLILNKIAEVLPQIRLFWMDSAHSRKAQPPKSALPVPPDYRL